MCNLQVTLRKREGRWEILPWKTNFGFKKIQRKSKSFKPKLYSPCANVDAFSLAKGFRSAAQNIPHKIIEYIHHKILHIHHKILHIHHKILKIHHKELKLRNKILNIRLKILRTQVCLWVIVPLENFSLTITGENGLYSALMAIEQWGF